LCATISQAVILGAFRRTFSSFSSRAQLDTCLVDSSACAEVSKKPTELMTRVDPR
jgi:hypothetical protein